MISGDAKVNTASGDVRMGGVGGEMRVNTASGDVQAKKIAGDARINTASGDVTIESVERIALRQQRVWRRDRPRRPARR